MPQQLPAVSLVAVPGRRRVTLEVAREIERRGFAGIYAPSVFSNMSLCEALAHVTERIAFGTSIAPIYARTVGDFAQSAAFLHEVSRGRFRLGIGVSHAPAHVRMGVTPGKPLGDITTFVQKLRTHDASGALPPVYLATLRKGMIALAGEIAVAEKRMDDVAKYLTDAWLADCTLFGPAARVREGLEAWYAAGVRTPIVVPSSASGNQMKAIEEMFATFTG